jgi:hypothetical protein
LQQNRATRTSDRSVHVTKSHKGQAGLPSACSVNKLSRQTLSVSVCVLWITKTQLNRGIGNRGGRCCLFFFPFYFLPSS